MYALPFSLREDMIAKKKGYKITSAYTRNIIDTIAKIIFSPNVFFMSILHVRNNQAVDFFDTQRDGRADKREHQPDRRRII